MKSFVFLLHDKDFAQIKFVLIVNNQEVKAELCVSETGNINNNNLY